MTTENEPISFVPTEDEVAAIAQAVANAWFAMEAGYQPSAPWEMPTPSGGDYSLASELLNSPLFAEHFQRRAMAPPRSTAKA